MSDLFLTREQLIMLTDRRRACKQIECLKKNRIPYTLDARGKPVVTIAAIEGTGRKADRTEKPAYIPSILQAAP